MKIKTTEMDKSHEHNDKQENPEIREYCGLTVTAISLKICKTKRSQNKGTNFKKRSVQEVVW